MHRNRQLLILALGLALPSSPGAARAEPPELAQGPSFLVARDADAVAEAACGPASLAEPVLRESVLRILERASLDPELAIVFTSAALSCGALFYVPVANDVRGIGYQHERPEELFDESPAARLEGIAFLGDYPYWRDNPKEFLGAFAHEIAHRYGARVHARLEGVDSDELLGREKKHWSYFLDSGGSPLEGNRFQALGAGTYRAYTPLGESAFSDFDLYLMGVLPKADVRAARLLRPRADLDAFRDCFGAPLDRESVPQWCEPLDLSADELSVSVSDLIAVEGERDPPAEDTSRTLDVAVLVLENGAPWSKAACEHFDATLTTAIGDFSRATRGRVALQNQTRTGDACVERDEPSSLLADGGCSVTERPTSGLHGLGLITAWVLRGMRRRRAGTSGRISSAKHGERTRGRSRGGRR